MSTEMRYDEYAFNAIPVLGVKEFVHEDMKAFAQLWGGHDLVTFAYVLQHAQGEDQMVAAFAIGHTLSAWARELLHPFPLSNDPGVRWAAALSLGYMREAQALAVLKGMLQDTLARVWLVERQAPAYEDSQQW